MKTEITDLFIAWECGRSKMFSSPGGFSITTPGPDGIILFAYAKE